MSHTIFKLVRFLVKWNGSNMTPGDIHDAIQIHRSLIFRKKKLPNCEKSKKYEVSKLLNDRKSREKYIKMKKKKVYHEIQVDIDNNPSKFTEF